MFDFTQPQAQAGQPLLGMESLGMQPRGFQPYGTTGAVPQMPQSIPQDMGLQQQMPQAPQMPQDMNANTPPWVGRQRAMAGALRGGQPGNGQI